MVYYVIRLLNYNVHGMRILYLRVCKFNICMFLDFWILVLDHDVSP